MARTHVANASAKASRFIDWLTTHVPAAAIDLDEMRAWGDAEWQRLAELVNEETGRSETMPTTSRSAIIVGLREHQRCAGDDGPFAGLPS